MVDNREQPTANDWKQLVTDSLKGKDWRVLTTQTAEGISIEPLYFERTDKMREQVSTLHTIWNSQVATFTKPLDSIEVDTRPVHREGADAVTELVAFLTAAHDYTETHHQLPSQVGFAVDTHFFMEIAKLRAARLVWHAFCHARKVEPTTLHIYAETSLRSYSLYDPPVNLLRSANSAFSAVIGGANAVAVYPYDELTGATATSERLAENVVEVIRHESFVTAVQDPSAGAYAVESLTDQLANEAWTLFLQTVELSVEERAQWFADRAQASFTFQLERLAKRKQALIGTTSYANPVDVAGTSVSDHGYKRLAEPFEKLRNELHSYSDKVVIIQAGEYKASKARVDYIKGVLSVYDWDAQVIDVETFHQVHDAYVYAVVAGTDEDSEAFVESGHSFEGTLNVAGNHPKLAAWREYGVQGAIYAGQSLLEKGSELVAVFKGQGEVK